MKHPFPPLSPFRRVHPAGRLATTMWCEERRELVGAIRCHAHTLRLHVLKRARNIQHLERTQPYDIEGLMFWEKSGFKMCAATGQATPCILSGPRLARAQGTQEELWYPEKALGTQEESRYLE